MGRAPKRMTAFAMATAIVLAAAPLVAVAGRTPPPPSPDHPRLLQLDDVAAPAISREAEAPVRMHYGKADIYLPTFFQPLDGRYDLVVHFHGMSSVQESNIERARLNAAIVSVTLGFGSGPYEEAYRDPGAFPRLIAAATRMIEKSGHANGARLGRVALSSWSAGYGAVSSILRQPANVNRIDALLMAEGPHSDYADKEHAMVDDAPLKKFERIARAARAGDKLFVLTHSAIHTDGYPSTTESIGELLRMTEMNKVADDRVGPRAMQRVYTSDAGDFHVKGYEGAAAKDHVDHIRAMGDTMYPYLKARWAR